MSAASIECQAARRIGVLPIGGDGGIEGRVVVLVDFTMRSLGRCAYATKLSFAAVIDSMSIVFPPNDRSWFTFRAGLVRAEIVNGVTFRGRSCPRSSPTIPLSCRHDRHRDVTVTAGNT